MRYLLTVYTRWHQAAQARLDALENDNEAGEILAGEGDDEVILHDDEEGIML